VQPQPPLPVQPTVSTDLPNGYFAPTSGIPAMLTSPYDQYSQGIPIMNHGPPPPQAHLPAIPLMPVTILSFPLDPIRHNLLGQVEYYFSIQNLTHDLFLRQQMDARGWIPVTLIASFNRVRQLTQDIQLVKDVLSLSSLVEVRGGYVRMSNGQWANFVLPDAPSSTVETGTADGARSRADESQDVEAEVEEDDEDDVEFVLGRDAGRSWTLNS